MTACTIMFFVRFIQAAEYGAANLYLAARVRVSAEDADACEDEEVLVALPWKMTARICKLGPLRIISDYAIDLVATILDFARAGEIIWTAPDCLWLFLYNCADATATFVPKKQT